MSAAVPPSGPARPAEPPRLGAEGPPGPGEPGERAGPALALVPLEVPAGRAQWTFEHGGRVYAVFEVAGELVVTDNACPHNGGPLAEGLVRDGVVTCPWHWYSYELATGRCRTAAGYRLRRYPVVRSGGRAYAALPPAAAARSWSQILRAHAREAASGGSAFPAGEMPDGG